MGLLQYNGTVFASIKDGRLEARSARGSTKLDSRRRSYRSLRVILLRAPWVTFALSSLGIDYVIRTAVYVIGGFYIASKSIVSLLHRSSSSDSISNPLFVVAGGALRTGSTFILNVLRVLTRVCDPNTVACRKWILQKLVPEHHVKDSSADRVAILRTLGISVLVKVHTERQYYELSGQGNPRRFADDVDMLYTSYRDLREESV